MKEIVMNTINEKIVYLPTDFLCLFLCFFFILRRIFVAQLLKKHCLFMKIKMISQVNSDNREINLKKK